MSIAPNYVLQEELGLPFDDGIRGFFDQCPECSKWVVVKEQISEISEHVDPWATLRNAMAHHRRVEHGIAVEFDHYAEAVRLLEAWGWGEGAKIHALLAIAQRLGKR